MPRSSSANSHESHVHPAPGSQAHEDKARAQTPETSVHPSEPEDTKSMAGGGSRQKDALGQNVDGEGKGDARQHPATPAGQHATGSFTGKGRV
ncbi:MAG TPA: hypothetical protein VHZ09_01620 [Acidobacteriaceae bacterium]|jgi:hypothetical protein|nr:hypothetical protein [Acidobacteriaceae bacterium]